MSWWVGLIIFILGWLIGEIAQMAFVHYYLLPMTKNIEILTKQVDSLLEQKSDKEKSQSEDCDKSVD